MRKLIAANWKMNKTVQDSVSYIKELKKLVKSEKACDIVAFPPFTAALAVAKQLKGSNLQLGAQNMYYGDSGAFTGEISPLMLKEAGCQFVLLGHSERREFFGEDDYLINRKVIAALKHSLQPILCIGETLQQRQQNKTHEALENQLRECLKNVDKKQILQLSIAYEPIWAISKGNPDHKPATKEDAENAHKFIRSVTSKIYDTKTAKNMRIIYGGSVKPENARELLSMPNINGALVGNASLDAKSFAEIVKAAKY